MGFNISRKFGRREPALQTIPASTIDMPDPAKFAYRDLMLQSCSPIWQPRRAQCPIPQVRSALSHLVEPSSPSHTHTDHRSGYKFDNGRPLNAAAATKTDGSSDG